MKKLTYISIPLLLFLSFTACFKNVNNPSIPIDGKPMAQKIVNQVIKSHIQEKGVFDWQGVSDELLWSALKISGTKLVVLGYQPEQGSNFTEQIHTIDLNSTPWKTARENILDLIYEEERKANPKLKQEEVLIESDTRLPVLYLQVSQLGTIRKVRRSKLFRYMEPFEYQFEDWLGMNLLGCARDKLEADLTSRESIVKYGNVAIEPGSWKPWNYAIHHIDKAWETTTGEGVTIMVIDTGIDENQPYLSDKLFNQGASKNRKIEKFITLPPTQSMIDECGHGTNTAAFCTAPRGIDSTAVGVAYNANLVAVKAAKGYVISNGLTARAVAKAFLLAADRDDIKIISMSMGTLISFGVMKDAIRYAYNKGKLIVCAAGSAYKVTAALFGVVFPATMKETVAVTGVREDLKTPCKICSTGKEVDFTVVIEKKVNDKLIYPLTLGYKGTNLISGFGGSSSATPTFAGMLALVWSKYPNATREEVLDRLIKASSNYPSKDKKFGWGIVDMVKAL